MATITPPDKQCPLLTHLPGATPSPLTMVVEYHSQEVDSQTPSEEVMSSAWAKMARKLYKNVPGVRPDGTGLTVLYAHHAIIPRGGSYLLTLKVVCFIGGVD